MSEPVSYEGLATRIEALERQSRRLKRQLFAALVALLCLGTVSATTAQQRTLSFSGPKGTLRIDASGVHLLTTKGKEVALFGYTKASTIPAVRFMEPSGTTRMIVGLDTDQDGLVRMFYRNGEKSIDLDGNNTLYFYDNSGTERLYVGTTTSGKGDFEIFNSSGKLQSELASEFLRLGDTTGTEREYIGITTTNEAVVKLWDHTHTERNFMGEFTDGNAGFTSYNTAGTSTWSSP
jgi:opacity protein-like surface antigen